MMTAVLDHLWQSSLFVLAAGLLARMVRANGAHVRYGLWLAASVKFLLPFSLLGSLGGVWASPLSSTLTGTFADTLADSIAASPVMNAVQPLAQPFALAAPSFAPTVSATDAHGGILPFVMLGIWGVGCAAILVFRLARWIRLEATVWAARPLAITAPLPKPRIPVKSTPYFLEPALIGIRRPVLLLPEGITEHLSTAELSAVLAHEHCHLRRRDNLTAMIHMLVEALFWFYPLVWWIGARLIEAREQACDESVVATGNGAEIYAESILKVCRSYVQSPLASAAGISGANLKKRIEDIMRGHDIPRMGPAKTVVLSLAGIAALAVPLTVGALAPLVAGGIKDAAAAIPDDIAVRLAEQQQSRKAVPIDPKILDRYVGTYALSPKFSVSVRRKDDHLLSRIVGVGPNEGGPSADFYPESDTKFFATVVAAQLEFIVDANGRVTEVVRHQNGFAPHAKRIGNKTAATDTEGSLRRYIAALQKGAPNYDDMTPALADQTRQQLSVLEENVKRWGALKSVAFESVNYLGADVYDATFEHGRVTWMIAPVTFDGKASGFAFNEIGP